MSRNETASPIKLLIGDSNFVYTVTELLNKRDRNGFFHIDDINLKIHELGNNDWQSFSSAKNRICQNAFNTNG